MTIWNTGTYLWSYPQSDEMTGTNYQFDLWASSPEIDPILFSLSIVSGTRVCAHPVTALPQHH